MEKQELENTKIKNQIFVIKFAENTLEELIANSNFKYILLSYNLKG